MTDIRAHLVIKGGSGTGSGRLNFDVRQINREENQRFPRFERFKVIEYQGEGKHKIQGVDRNAEHDFVRAIGRSAYQIPVGEIVTVGWINNDRNAPYILGRGFSRVEDIVRVIEGITFFNPDEGNIDYRGISRFGSGFPAPVNGQVRTLHQFHEFGPITQFQDIEDPFSEVFWTPGEYNVGSLMAGASPIRFARMGVIDSGDKVFVLRPGFYFETLWSGDYVEEPGYRGMILSLFSLAGGGGDLLWELKLGTGGENMDWDRPRAIRSLPAIWWVEERRCFVIQGEIEEVASYQAEDPYYRETRTEGWYFDRLNRIMIISEEGNILFDGNVPALNEKRLVQAGNGGFWTTYDTSVRRFVIAEEIASGLVLDKVEVELDGEPFLTPVGEQDGLPICFFRRESATSVSTGELIGSFISDWGYLYGTGDSENPLITREEEFDTAPSKYVFRGATSHSPPGDSSFLTFINSSSFDEMQWEQDFRAPPGSGEDPLPLTWDQELRFYITALLDSTPQSDLSGTSTRGYSEALAVGPEGDFGWALIEIFPYAGGDAQKGDRYLVKWEPDTLNEGWIFTHEIVEEPVSLGQEDDDPYSGLQPGEVFYPFNVVAAPEKLIMLTSRWIPGSDTYGDEFDMNSGVWIPGGPAGFSVFLEVYEVPV